MRVMTVPDIADLVAGDARVEEVREIDAKDLLGREPVPPNPALLDACVREQDRPGDRARADRSARSSAARSSPRAEAARAARNVGARALQHRAGTARHARAQSTSISNWWACSAMPTTRHVFAKS